MLNHKFPSAKFLKLFLSALILSLSFYNRALAANQIVAIVNNDTITKKELEDFAVFMRMQISRDYSEAEADKKIQEIKSDLLNKMIEDRLIFQEAKKAKINLSESRVKFKIAEVKKQYESDADFQADLLKQGLTQTDLEFKIREQMLTFAIIEQKIRGRIVISPEEVTAFYNGNIDKFKTPEERDLDLFILEGKNLGESFSYMLKIGKSAEELAGRYPYVFNKLTVSRNEELKKEISSVVFNLAPGEVSKAVMIDGKYYVFRLNTITPAKQETLSQAQEKISAIIFDLKMRKEMSNWLDELKKKSYIKIMKN